MGAITGTRAIEASGRLELRISDDFRKVQSELFVIVRFSRVRYDSFPASTNELLRVYRPFELTYVFISAYGLVAYRRKWNSELKKSSPGALTSYEPDRAGTGPYLGGCYCKRASCSNSRHRRTLSCVHTFIIAVLPACIPRRNHLLLTPDLTQLSKLRVEFTGVDLSAANRDLNAA